MASEVNFASRAEPRRLPQTADPGPSRIDVSPPAGLWEDEPAVALFAPRAARVAGSAGATQGPTQGPTQGTARMGLSAEARAARAGAEDGNDLLLDMAFFDSEALFEDEAPLFAEDLQDDLFEDLEDEAGYVGFDVDDEPDLGWAADEEFSAYSLELDLEAEARDEPDLASGAPAEVGLFSDALLQLISDVSASCAALS